MKKDFLFSLILGALLLGLSAMELPINITKVKNPNVVYAFGRRPGHRPGNGHGVPEPSLLILLGSGIVGIAGFRYWRNNKKQDKSEE